MTVHDDLVYMRHIAGALDKIASYTRGLTQAEFDASSMIQDAVVRQFEVIGEATKNVICFSHPSRRTALVTHGPDARQVDSPLLGRRRICPVDHRN